MNRLKYDIGRKQRERESIMQKFFGEKRGELEAVREHVFESLANIQTIVQLHVIVSKFVIE